MISQPRTSECVLRWPSHTADTQDVFGPSADPPVGFQSVLVMLVSISEVLSFFFFHFIGFILFHLVFLFHWVKKTVLNIGCFMSPFAMFSGVPGPAVDAMQG